MPLLIIIIGVALVAINYYAITKEKKSFTNVLNNQENLEKDYDIELFAIRKDMAESILDLQKEIRELKQYIDNKEISPLQNNVIVKERVITDDIIKDMKNKPSVVAEINYENKPQKGANNKTKKANKGDSIKAMIALGDTDEEICKKLKVGKGEVLLTRSLFK